MKFLLTVCKLQEIFTSVFWGMKSTLCSGSHFFMFSW